MYLWDANILRAFGQGHATLCLYLLRVPWAEIALPSVVVAEVLRGRCECALKATPAEAPLAHQRLVETQQMLAQFHVVVFDAACATVLERFRQQHRQRKRYADLMIAAITAAGQHVLVTRNQADFRDVLPQAQLANWIDEPPGTSLP
jgi:predicted nucleic acid-binding protein